MFKIDIEHNGITYHIQTGIDNVVINPMIDDGVNQVDTLTFEIPFDDTFRPFYESKVTTVTVYNESNIVEFKGILGHIEDMELTLEMTFYSELIYLSYVEFPPYSFQGDIPQLIDSILSYYNSHCSDYRKIERGIITVTDANGYITRENQDDSTCYQVIFDKLVNMLGGYIRLRYLNDKRYLDYLVDYSTVAPQNIEYRVNLLQLLKTVDTSELATVIVPRGHRNAETNKRLTIESINNGLDYIESPLVAKYGIMRKVIIWDDVTLAENLKSKAESYLLEYLVKEAISYKIKAIDLGFTSDQIRRFAIGDTITIESEPHNANLSIMLGHRQRHLNEPSEDILQLGDIQKSFTQSFNSVENKSNENESKLGGSYLDTLINQQTQSLMGGLGGNVKTLFVDGKPVAHLYMDTDSEVTAKNVLMINAQGIGFSQDGVYGTYHTAWTLEGGFNERFIYTGIISGARIKIDLETGEMIWGRRDSNGDFIDSDSIRFDPETLVINARKGLSIDDSRTLFRSKLTENEWKIEYDNVTLLHIEPTGMETENVTVNKYITLKNVSRIERFNFNGVTYTGHYSLGGNY